MKQTKQELDLCPCLDFVSSNLIKHKSYQNSSWLYQYLGKNLNPVECALAQNHNCEHTNLKVKQRQRICQTSKWRPKWLWVLYWEKPLPSKITARPLCTISEVKFVVSTGPIRPFKDDWCSSQVLKATGAPEDKKGFGLASLIWSHLWHLYLLC